MDRDLTSVKGCGLSVSGMQLGGAFQAMLVTFNNRLDLVEEKRGTLRILYRQILRAGIKVFIDYVPDPAVQEQNNNRDWRISVEGDKATVTQLMASLSREITLYLRQRTRQRFRNLRFLDIVDLAKVRSID